MTTTNSLKAEVELAEALLRTEANQLEELAEKRRMIVDGIAELEAPSEVWDAYLRDIDGMIEMTHARIDELATLRDEVRARLEMRH